MGRALAAGMLGGALWGVVARVFMRLLSDDPQFSWEGTLGIVGVAALAGASVGLVHAARVTGRSRWWRLAALPGLLLFAGPGSLLLPTTVGMAAVLRGRPVVRALGVVVAMVPLVVLAGNEPPLPPKATFEQTKNLVEALARGTPDAGQIARNIALGKIRELI